MRQTLLTALLGISLFISCTDGEPASPDCGLSINQIDSIFQHAVQQSMLLAQELQDQPDRFPKTLDEEGNLVTSDIHWWCCGFFPGTLWMLSEQQPDNLQLRELAKEFTQRVEPVKDEKGSHDIGFMLQCSYGQAFRITSDSTYLSVLRNGAKNLAGRFMPKAGVIKSWDWPKQWQNAVIIDNMMNLELLEFVGHLDNDSLLLQVADSHAQQTQKNHYRPDNSCYHVVDYDAQTGEVLNRQTAQGYADESAWARGQAWGLYGYTMMFRETGNSLYLQQAQQIAKYLIHRTNWPDDLIPYWDFDCPEIPDTQRDASTAAIMASALLELYMLDTQSQERKEWLQFAAHQLQSLSSSDYLASLGSHHGFILMHSTGHRPNGTEVDVPLSYADYYYVEALTRLKKIQSMEK